MIPKQLLLTVLSSQLFPKAAGSQRRSLEENPLDYYCGTSWPNAADACMQSCPDGDDAVCSNSLGEEYFCFGYTGCNDKLATDDGSDGDGSNAVGDVEGVDVSEDEDLLVAANKYCGATW
jgi:hypothetical protein